MVEVIIVTEDGKERSVQVQQGTNLLDAVMSSGVEMEWSCRTGECGICQVTILAGEESLSEPDTDETDMLFDRIDDGVRLACKTKVLGPDKVRVKVRTH